MDLATLAAICVLHAQNPAAYPLPPPTFDCTPRAGRAVSPALRSLARLRPVVSTPAARDAMARTVIAEAGNQGDSGLAGVAYTILNRLADGRWGGTVEAVVDAPGQFEPVMRAGGSWRDLRPVSAAQATRVSTIVNLALDGRLPDPTRGARYFQNPQIVTARARAGTVSSSRVSFGGAAPSAVIGAHAFYVAAGIVKPVEPRRAAIGQGAPEPAPGDIFVGENRMAEVLAPRTPVAGEGGSGRAAEPAAQSAGGGISAAD
jgi:hypothetical protein